MSQFKTNDRKKNWFENFLYIFNMHWDKVDNFRIDKYLMFLRFQIFQVLTFLKDTAYDRKLMKWYKKLIFKLFTDQQMAKTASGIPLQICDIFVQEMNKVDASASLETLADLLEPFLKSLAAI